MKLLWQQIANTTVTEILCSTAMDGVVLDCEHGYWNNETIVDCIRVIRLSGKQAFVRMKYNNQLIQLCVDNGCNGMIFSKVENVFECTPGLGLCVNNSWGEMDLLGKDFVRIAQIESKIGIYNIYKRFDYYMLGLYDLSVDVGTVGNFNSSATKKMINQFESNIPVKKRGVHIVKNFEEYDRYKDYGFIAFSLDTLSLVKGVKELNKYA